LGRLRRRWTWLWCTEEKVLICRLGSARNNYWPVSCHLNAGCFMDSSSIILACHLYVYRTWSISLNLWAARRPSNLPDVWCDTMSKLTFSLSTDCNVANDVLLTWLLDSHHSWNLVGAVLKGWNTVY
jgi:hypothetical protein